MNKKTDIEKNIDKYIKNVDVGFVNKMLGLTDLKDFQIDMQTIRNVSEWALNGSSDTEIRKKLSLNKHEWSILCNVCPTLLVVMQESRAMADIVVAGTLFQTAIGGKKIKKEQLVRIREYDEKGLVCGEHYEKMEVEEELPPNPVLLKFLAENKLSEKFGENKNDTNAEYKQIVDRFTKEELELIELAKKSEQNAD